MGSASQDKLFDTEFVHQLIEATERQLPDLNLELHNLSVREALINQISSYTCALLLGAAAIAKTQQSAIILGNHVDEAARKIILDLHKSNRLDSWFGRMGSLFIDAVIGGYFTLLISNHILTLGASAFVMGMVTFVWFWLGRSQ